MPDTMPDTEPYTGPPDITKDRLVVINGGVTFGMTRLEKINIKMPTWITIIPVEESEQQAGSFPRERHIRITHSVQVGTVDELVELYRKQLTNCYNAFVVKQPDGQEPVVIPQFGEASMGQQNACLHRNGIVSGENVQLYLQPEEYEKFMARKYDKYGHPKPRQSEMERDRLKRAVANYLAYRYPDAESETMLPPTDSPEHVDKLIAALTILKEDSLTAQEELRRRAEANAPKPTAGELGADVAKD